MTPNRHEAAIKIATHSGQARYVCQDGMTPNRHEAAIKIATLRHEVAMNARPMLAAFFLLVPVTAACAGTDTPTVTGKRTVVSTYCTTSDNKFLYTNKTYALWSDGSSTEVARVTADVPCPK